MWKVKRELKRLKMQAEQWHWFVFGHMRRHRYDRTKRADMRLTEGRIAATRDMAILLVYRPDGLPGSVFDTVEHFQQQGVAPVLVSNAPLSDADRARLSLTTHLIVERPNFGYDFGGYRDAILILNDRGPLPDHLFVLNDSIWFPVWPDCDLVERAVAEEADLYGIYFQERENEPHRSHLQSYFYRFGPQLTQGPDFVSYWQNLRMTNNKFMVVRQNEMKLTHYFTSRGYSCAHLFDHSAMKQAVLGLTDDQLHEVLRYQARVETKFTAEIEAVLSAPAEERREMVAAMIDRKRLSRYFMIAHPHTFFGQMHSPMAKKDKQDIYVVQREEMVRHGYDQKMRPVVAEEIRNWDKR